MPKWNKPIQVQLTLSADIGIVDPQPDITPLEAARLAELLVCCLAASHAFCAVDSKAFVAKHNLGRHFRPQGTEPEQKQESWRDRPATL